MRRYIAYTILIVAQLCSAMAMGIGLMGLAGAWSGRAVLGTWGWSTPMALPTAAAIILMSLAILLVSLFNPLIFRTEGDETKFSGPISPIHMVALVTMICCTILIFRGAYTEGVPLLIIVVTFYFGHLAGTAIKKNKNGKGQL